MRKLNIFKILVEIPDEMSEQEAEFYVKEQLAIKPGKALVEMKIQLAGDTVLIEPHYDTVRRVRRITGYLGKIDNFNDAKKAEEVMREKHL